MLSPFTFWANNRSFQCGYGQFLNEVKSHHLNTYLFKLLVHLYWGQMEKVADARVSMSFSYQHNHVITNDCIVY